VAPYIEPYLRPQIPLGGGKGVFEVGVFLKINVALVPNFPATLRSPPAAALVTSLTSARPTANGRLR